MPDNDDLVVFERLRSAWQTHRAPIADHLAPGLTETELETIEASAGLVLPAELRRWWGWHDGVQRRIAGTSLGPESLLGAGPWELLSLAEALRYRDLMVQLTEEFEEDDEVRWLPEWLPVVHFDGSYLFATCGAPRAERSEVRRWTKVPDDPYTVRAPSWTAAVETFTGLLESGVHPADGRLRGLM